MGDGVTSGVIVASVDVSPLIITIGAAADGLSPGDDESFSSPDGGAGGLSCGGRLIVVLPRVTAPSGVSVVPGPMMNSVTSLVTVAVIVEFPMTSAGKVGDAAVVASGVVDSMLEMVSRSSESEMTGISADRAMADVRSWRVALEDLIDEEGLVGACRVLLVALDDEDKLVRTRGAVVLADLEDEEADLEVDDDDVDATTVVEAIKVGLLTEEVRTKEAA